LVWYDLTVKLGYFDEMTWLQPAARSRAFSEVRSPSTMAIVPGLLACDAM